MTTSTDLLITALLLAACCVPYAPLFKPLSAERTDAIARAIEVGSVGVSLIALVTLVVVLLA